MISNLINIFDAIVVLLAFAFGVGFLLHMVKTRGKW